jgi:SMODS and SLOG-associating 2TM effector domain 1/Protein of unknown function (DUF4231)
VTVGRFLRPHSGHIRNLGPRTLHGLSLSAAYAQLDLLAERYVTEALLHVADRAVTWSETADRLKLRLDRVRWLVFASSISGALAAALASQISTAGSTVSTHSIFAAIGTVLLATSTFVSSRFLRDNDLQAWVRARAASEALKREAFRYAAHAKPYDHAATADQILITERSKIEDGVDNLSDLTVSAKRRGSSPRAPLTAQQYREQRIEDQVKKFYRPKAEQYRKIASRLRTIEFLLALAATAITALAGVVGKTIPVGVDRFDLAALTAVLTTVSGAILAHIEASRYQYLVTSYLATARRLEDVAADSIAAAADPNSWSDFVNRCEDIIATENNSWMAKWTH